MSTTGFAGSAQLAPTRCRGRVTHLVLRCGQGDEAALGDLFDLTYFLVAAVVNPRGVASAGADQAVIEAFWRIWHRSPAYVPTEAGVLAWVFDQVHDRPASLAGRARHGTNGTR